MFSKTLFVLFFAALAQLQLVIATPPACLLGAVKGYSDPSDIEAVCKQKDVTGKVTKLCGSNTDDALSSLAEICSKAGVKVSTKVISSGTASSTASGTASGTAPGTASAYASRIISGTGAHASATGSGSNSGSGNATLATTIGTATGGSVPSATGPASAPENTGAAGKLELSAAALVAGFGLLAAAL